MDQDIEIINSNTRREKLITFIKKNKKKLLIAIILIVLSIISFFVYNELKKRNEIKISENYNISIIQYKSGNTQQSVDNLKNLIGKKHKTYSILAFYFLLDNNLITSKSEINSYFDLIINKINLENELKNLVIYKKALFNAETADENTLLSILNPLFKSDSVWSSHGQLLLAQYFLEKKEKQKAKEFLEKIITSENSNTNIKNDAQKILLAEFN